MYLGRNHYPVGVAAGILGGVAVGLASLVFRVLQLTEFDFAKTLWPSSWLIGFVLEIFIGGALGALYTFVFRATGQAGRLEGAVLGLATGFIISFILPFAPGRPGLFAINYGGFASFEVLGLCAAFGSFIGGTIEELLRRSSIPGLPNEPQIPVTPLADSLGQGSTEYDEYKNRSA